jgi:CubicO group peptidase (beta-lactamase class C family)
VVRALLSTRSYGHTGYTGTAIRIDPETQTFLIVLTNRLHPDGRNILPMLRRVAEVAGCVEAASSSRAVGHRRAPGL